MRQHLLTDVCYKLNPVYCLLSAVDSGMLVLMVTGLFYLVKGLYLGHIQLYLGANTAVFGGKLSVNFGRNSFIWG